MENLFIKRIKKKYLNDNIAYYYLEKKEIKDQITYKELYDKYLYYKNYFEQLKIDNKLCMLYMTAGVDFIPVLFGLVDSNYKPIIKTIGPSVAKEKLFGQLDELKKEMTNISTIITNYDYPEFSSFCKELNLNYVNLEDMSCTINNSDKKYTVDADILLLTSGSTKVSKGVLIKLEQLEKNVIFCKNLWSIDLNDICLDWMPHSHIYGLVTGFLLPIYTGGISYIMSPKDYSNNFDSFFECLELYKITHTHTPASNMFLEKGGRYEGKIDLSSIKAISLGGEAINYTLLDEFNKKHGLTHNIFSPNYGMSEISGLLCAIKKNRKLFVLDVNQYDLKFNNKITIDNKFNSCKLVSVGKVKEEEVLIVEPNTFNQLGQLAIGEIVISVDSISNGYINEEDNKAFVNHDGRRYYRSQDLGFKSKDYLIVTGRLKEIIKINGKNISPYEIENCILLSKLSKDIKNVVAFAKKDNVAAKEEIGIFIETDMNNKIIKEIKEMIKDKLQIKVKEKNILFLRKNTIPRFSNGKISRKQCNELFNQIRDDENEKS